MSKRLLSIMLAMLMLFSLLPMSAMAVGGEDDTLPSTLQYDDYLPLNSFGESTVTVSEEDSAILEVKDGYIHAIGVGTATLTVGKAEYTITVEPAKLNVVLVSGQSNAEGFHGGLDQEPISPSDGYGYVWDGSKLISFSEKVSQVKSEHPDKSIGWYPALAAEWYALTGEKTVIILNCASGNPISTWASYTDGTLNRKTKEIVSEVSACLDAIDGNSNYKIVRTGYYWLQGETDAYLTNNSEGITDYTTAERYVTAYKAMHGAFINALTVTGTPAPYGAILSCRTRNDISNFKALEYCGMRVAQQHLANTVENLYMASVITDEWYESKDIRFTAKSNQFSPLTYNTGAMGANNIHYNQSGYNVIGLDAADNMYQALVKPGNESVTEIELIGHNGYTKYEENSTIYVEDNKRYIGTNNVDEDNGKAQLVARPLPISADPDTDSVTMTLTADSSNVNVEGVMDEYGLIDIKKLKAAVGENGGRPLTLTVTAGSVTNTYFLTSEEFATDENTGSFHYKWDFTLDSSYETNGDGKVTVSSLFDDNTLTYTASSTTHGEDGLDNTSSNWFDMAEAITLNVNQAWTIEWKGSMNTGNGVLLSNNDSNYDDTSTGRTTPYLYLRNGGDTNLTKPTGYFDVTFDFMGPVGGNDAVQISIEDAKNASFTSMQTWKLSNDGSGKLTLSNGTKTWTSAKSLTEAATFNGLLGRFGTRTKLCYNGTIAYVEIYTPDRANDVVPVSIEVTKQPDKLIYEVGESFDPDGMVVTVTDSEGNKETVTGYTWSAPSGGLQNGSNTITIRYAEGSKTLTTTLEVYVGESTVTTTGNSYYWDFTEANGGTTLEAVSGGDWDENTLTYKGTMPKVTDGTFTNGSSGYFTTATNINLSKDKAWTIEWQGSITSNSVLLANNQSGDAATTKNEYFYIFNDAYSTSPNDNRLSLRTKGTSSYAAQFANISNDMRLDSNAVWRLTHSADGVFTLTITPSNGEAYSSNVTDGTDQDFTFNGVLGRFTNTNSLCYTGQISYLKVWEEVVPDHLDISVKDDVELQIGQTLSSSDITVTAVYNDGSEREVQATQISAVTYDTDGQPTFTVQALVDGVVLDGEVKARVNASGYHWAFTGNVTENNQIESSVDTQHNTLTYSKNTLTLDPSNGLTNDRGSYFTMETPITLLKNAPWTIEWQGSTTANSVLLAYNDDDDATSPYKSGPYVYIYNDLGIELGNSVSLRKQNTTAAATFSGISDAAKKNPDTVWYLIHDGQGNLTLACKSGELTTVTTLENVIDRDYTFNSVLGYFTKNNQLCYTGTIKYLKIYPTAAQVEGTTGILSVNTSGITNETYNVGEEPDLTGMTVTFTPYGDGQKAQTITNYTYKTEPAIITSDTEQVEVTVSAFNTTDTATFGVEVTENAPANFHWAVDDNTGDLTSQDDATANTLTKNADGRYYTMTRPVSLDSDNHWRIEWTGSVRSGTSNVLLSANTKSNATTALRSTPYIYIRNGSDGGKYDISIVPSGMVGNAVAKFDIPEGQRNALSVSTTWTLEYNDGQLTLSNNRGYSVSENVTIDSMTFNGIRGYFATQNTLYYSGTLTDLKIYENIEADYRWDFDDSYVSGNTLHASAGDVDLTYTDSSIPVKDDGLANDSPNYFNMDSSVTLPDDKPWTIEWQGSIKGNSVLLANNDDKTDDHTPSKAGEYLYIYNDSGRDDGDRIALRTENTTGAATFSIPDGLLENDEITWYLVHDGQRNLTLGWADSDGLYYAHTVNGAVTENFVFNGVLGYFTTDNKLCYEGDIKYIEISMEAKDFSNAEGELRVDASAIKKTYTAGDVLDLSNLGVTYEVGENKYDIISYSVIAEPAVLTPETTEVTVTVSAFDQTVAETITVTVNSKEPAYYHWTDTDGSLDSASDGAPNALTAADRHYDMTETVYLDAENHWRIEWTGALESGDNGILLSANSEDYTSRITPYLYIRNGGDNGEYDISLVYSGAGTAGDGSPTVVRFTLTDAAKTALSKETTTWTLDYEDGKLSLYYDDTLVETKSVSVRDIAFNGICGYYTSATHVDYIGTLTDLKIYEALYDVTVRTATNGSVVVDHNENVYPGQTITITVTPEEGYELDTLTVTSGEESVQVSNNQFTMPASDVTISATFKEDTPDEPEIEKHEVRITPVTHGDVVSDKAAAAAGETVTITVDPDSGYRLADLTVKDSSGTELELEYIGNGKYTFVMPEGAVTVDADFTRITNVKPPVDEPDEPEEPEKDELPFVDFDGGDWFYDSVYYVYANGLMDGVSETQFAPNSNLTRGMVVTILYRLEGEPRVTGSSGFTDVASGAWYADPVTWAAANGIVNGVSDTEFAPNTDITREQLAAILFRYAEYKGYDVSGRDSLTGYTDRGSISAYALDAMRWAVDEGLITGMTATTIEPQGTATRAQCAAMLMRFIENVA